MNDYQPLYKQFTTDDLNEVVGKQIKSYDPDGNNHAGCLQKISAVLSIPKAELLKVKSFRKYYPFN